MLHGLNVVNSCASELIVPTSGLLRVCPSIDIRHNYTLQQPRWASSLLASSSLKFATEKTDCIYSCNSLFFIALNPSFAETDVGFILVLDCVIGLPRLNRVSAQNFQVIARTWYGMTSEPSRNYVPSLFLLDGNRMLLIDKLKDLTS